MTTEMIIIAIATIVYLFIGFFAGWLAKEVLAEDHVEPKTVYYDIRVYVGGLFWIVFLIWILIAVARESHDDLETSDLY
jgi:hypothetical protein